MGSVSAVPLQALSAEELELESIDRLIAGLDAEDFGQRQRAEAKLVGLGEAALDKLNLGARGASPEQRARLSKIVSN